MLEISVIRSAEYKLPINSDICICMFSLYVKIKFTKNDSKFDLLIHQSYPVNQYFFKKLTTDRMSYLPLESYNLSHLSNHKSINFILSRIIFW